MGIWEEKIKKNKKKYEKIIILISKIIFKK